MKYLSPFLFLAALIISGCANDAIVNHSDSGSVQPSVQPTEKPVGAANTESSKSICADADAGALPSNQCSETVSAAFDNHGVLWIAWVNNGHIYLQSSDDKGLSFSEPVPVNPIAEKVEAKGEYRPKIKLDAKGNIYLTWTLKIEGRHNGHIRFSRAVDGGRRFSAPVTVNNNVDIISHRFDSMAIGKNGEIFIAWLDGRDFEAEKKAGKAFDGSSLYYTWSDDGGAHFYPDNRIATHTCQCCRLDTAIAPDNTPVVTWRHIFEGGVRDHALVKFNDWNTPGDTHRVGNDNWKIDACPHHGPGLSISDSGIYHAVWFSNSPSHQGLFYAHSTDAGRHFSALVNFAKEGSGHPHVLAVGARVNVVWQEFDGVNNVIKLIKSVDDGKTWSKPAVIAQSASSGDQPFLLSDGRKIYLSWKIPQQDYRLLPVEQ